MTGTHIAPATSFRARWKNELFLTGAGCTINLVGKHVFHMLPTAFRATLQKAHSSGRQVDGTHLHFYGEIMAIGRLGKPPIQDKLVVSQIRDHVILGMPLVAHGCD